MVSITWKDGSHSHIEIIRSKDKLDKMLKSLIFEKASGMSFREVKKGKLTLKEYVYAVSYDTGDELALLRRYKLVPKAEDYPYEYPEIQ